MKQTRGYVMDNFDETIRVRPEVYMGEMRKDSRVQVDLIGGYFDHPAHIGTLDGEEGVFAVVEGGPGFFIPMALITCINRGDGWAVDMEEREWRVQRLTGYHNARSVARRNMVSGIQEIGHQRDLDARKMERRKRIAARA